MIRSIKICLSVRVLFGSLSPGESMRVILPLFAIFTNEVIATKDFFAENSKASAECKNFLVYNSDIFESKVDLPWPHSPKTAIVSSLIFY